MLMHIIYVLTEATENGFDDGGLLIFLLLYIPLCWVYFAVGAKDAMILVITVGGSFHSIVYGLHSQMVSLETMNMVQIPKVNN